MIFTGDVAIAEGDTFVFTGFPEYLLGLPLCVNLEGAVKDNDGVPCKGVYNSELGLSSFADFNFGSPFIANNHIHDLDNGVVKTKKYFEKKNLNVIGAGVNIHDSRSPVLFESEGKRYFVLGYGWPVIGCVPAKKNKPGVNAFDKEVVLRQVVEHLNEYKNTRLVVVIHGNYEFEPYPQPSHRKLARDLIDLGVYSVIFHHPHIVGPIERYKGKTIAYSLGNWAFSYGRFFDGRLIFSPSSFHQIAIELGDKDILHHAMFHPPNKVAYDKSEEILSDDLSLRAEFEGFNDEQYLRWFKKNRHKNKMLPIYKASDTYIFGSFKDCLVYLRQLCIDFAVKARLKSLRR